jgi:transcriptional regulator GlxA family with amidase domain
MESPVRDVIIVIYPRVNILDVAGPVQVFTTANERLEVASNGKNGKYRIQVVAAVPGQIATTSGVEIHASSLPSLGAKAHFDTILVAGGHGAEMAGGDESLTSWLRLAQSVASRFGCICTGAFVLARAGMLAGRRVATHWAYCEQLQAADPGLDVERDAIFIEEHGFWSSAGVTAGMDLALAMVEQDFGRAAALEVARRLVVFLKRPGGQSQFSMPLQAQSAEGPLAKLMRAVVDSPAEDWRVERLAQNAGLSERSLFRLFKEVTSGTPADWVEEVRTERARRMLEDEAASVDRIALEAGFGSAERLRRVFTRRLGVAPSVYRDRFSLHSAQK